MGHSDGRRGGRIPQAWAPRRGPEAKEPVRVRLFEVLEGENESLAKDSGVAFAPGSGREGGRWVSKGPEGTRWGVVKCPASYLVTVGRSGHICQNSRG